MKGDIAEGGRQALTAAILGVRIRSVRLSPMCYSSTNALGGELL